MSDERRRIYLMRHGEVSYFGSRESAEAGVDAAALTARGAEQARTAGRLLRAVRFDRVVTSGLPRTVATAELVLGENDATPELPLETEPDLVEMRPGDPRAIPEDGLEREFLAAFRADAPRTSTLWDGESVGELLDRAIPAFDRLCSRDWHTLLLVLHGGINRALLSYALTGEPRFLGHIEQSPACVNILDHGPAWYVRTINMTAYDPVHDVGRATTAEGHFAEFLEYRRQDLGG